MGQTEPNISKSFELCKTARESRSRAFVPNRSCASCGPAPGRRLESPPPRPGCGCRAAQSMWTGSTLPCPTRSAEPRRLRFQADRPRPWVGLLSSLQPGAPLFLTPPSRTTPNSSGCADTWPGLVAGPSHSQRMDGCAERRAPPGHTKTRPRPAMPLDRRGDPLAEVPRPRRTQRHFPRAKPILCSGIEDPLRVLQWGVARPHPSLLDPEQRAWRARTWRLRAWTRASPAAFAFLQLGPRPHRSILREGSAQCPELIPDATICGQFECAEGF